MTAVKQSQNSVGSKVSGSTSLVIRILFNRWGNEGDAAIAKKVCARGSEVASSVAMTEEEFWICHYPQGAVIDRASREHSEGS